MFIEPIINMFKIKFVVLDKIISEKITSGEHINIFVNLETIFDRLYVYNTTKDVIKDLRGSERISLSSEIINLISHYRYYFNKTFGVTSTFFLYYGNTKPSYNCSVYSFYDYSSFERKAMNNTNHHEANLYIEDNLNLVKVVIDYIPDCYYIDTDDIEKSLVPYYIIEAHCSQHRHHVNLILSRDVYDLQFPTRPNTFVLHLDRDDSVLIGKDDIWAFYSKVNQINQDTFLAPELISLVYSLAGVKTRNIKGIHMVGAARAIKFIERMVSNGDIANSLLQDVERLNDILNPKYAGVVIPNFQIIDLAHQYLQLTTRQKYNVDKALETNKYDLEALMSLNVEYYAQNPIEINRVFRGVR